MGSLKLGALELLALPFQAQVGTSMGYGSPITTTIESLFIDGDVVTGDRTGNREIVLRVLVKADDRAVLAQAVEALLSELDAASNLLVVTPDGAAAQVYETYRATSIQRVTPDQEELNGLWRIYEARIPARPWVRGLTRLYPSAAAPLVAIEDFETSPQGVVMVSPGINVSSATWMAAPVADFNATPTYWSSGQTAAQWPAATGATVSSQSPSYGSVRNVARFTGAGVFTGKSTAHAFTGDFVTVALAAWMVAGQSLTAGVEWLDAGGASLGTDWGIPVPGSGSSRAVKNAWVVARKPAGATQVRALVAGDTAGTYVDVNWQLVMPNGTVGALTQSSAAAFRGSYGLYLQTSPASIDLPSSFFRSFFVHGDVAAVDLSGLPTVGVYVRQGTVGATSQTLGADAAARLRLYDADGNWSQWDLTGTLTTSWARLTAPVGSPQATHGTLDLAAVTGYDVAFAGAGSLYHVDYVHAGPEPSATVSTRGSVLDLSILGSAPSTAAVTLTSGVAMTDWYVACIDGTHGDPLLAVTANVATAAAPAGYGQDDPEATYQVIGCLAPAAALASPTCTVAQKIGGVQVATRTLTGVAKPGNRYVDFGPVELPLVPVPDENQAVSYTFTLAPSSTSWTEVLVVDVDAAFAWLPTLTVPRKVGFIDEPDLLTGLGRVYVGDATDRSDARAPSTVYDLGRPLQVRSPGTRLVGYSTSGAPDVVLGYYERNRGESTGASS